MKLVSNTFITIGVSAIILASMMVDETYSPMTANEFAVQAIMIFAGMFLTFVGVIMKTMSE